MSRESLECLLRNAQARLRGTSVPLTPIARRPRSERVEDWVDDHENIIMVGALVLGVVMPLAVALLFVVSMFAGEVG